MVDGMHLPPFVLATWGTEQFGEDFFVVEHARYNRFPIIYGPMKVEQVEPFMAEVRAVAAANLARMTNFAAWATP